MKDKTIELDSDIFLDNAEIGLPNGKELEVTLRLVVTEDNEIDQLKEFDPDVADDIRRELAAGTIKSCLLQVTAKWKDLHACDYLGAVYLRPDETEDSVIQTVKEHDMKDQALDELKGKVFELYHALTSD